MKPARIAFLTLAAVLLISAGAPLLRRTMADTKPAVQLNVENATPRQVDDAVQQAIVRDYSAAWQALSTGMSTNNAAALNENFVGFALDKFMQRIRDQQTLGLKTRIIDHGHTVEAVFYSLDGSAMEVKDTASIETQILEGNTVIHSDLARIQYYAIMTGAEDHWKVRVLESTKGD
jgi:hypothetical protein